MNKEPNDVTNQHPQQISDNPAPAPPAGPTDRHVDQPVSSKKMEANRVNAQKSTGPRSEAGKAKSAANSHKHGFFAKALFPASEQTLQDQQDYVDLAKSLRGFYQPEGFMEEFWVEKIATEMLRLRRVMTYEQWMMTKELSKHAFEARSLDRTQRYQTTLDRQLGAAFKEIERLQVGRKRDTALDDQNEQEANDAVTGAEPSTLPNPEPAETPADKVIDESDSTFAATEESAISDSDATAPVENAGTKPPADANGQVASPSPNTSDGLKPNESAPDLSRGDESAGTNPDDTFDLLARLVDEVGPANIIR